MTILKKVRRGSKRGIDGKEDEQIEPTVENEPFSP